MARMKDSFVVQQAVEGTDSWTDVRLSLSNAHDAGLWVREYAEPGQRYRIVSVRSGILTIRTEEVRKLEEVEDDDE